MTEITPSSAAGLSLTIAKHSNVLEHIKRDKRPLERPLLLPRTEMPSRRPTEDWVLSLRTYIKTQLDKDVGTNWQIREGKGKVRLGIRFEDGTRTYKYLPYKWERINHGKIQDFIKEVHYLHIEKRLPIDDAFAQVKASHQVPDAPRKPTDPQLILRAWDEYKEYKVDQTKSIKPTTWEKEYQSKLAWRLAEVADSSNARQLFTKLIKVKARQGNRKGLIQPAGSNSRKRTIENVQSFLSWATGAKSNYLLSEDFIPPEDLSDFVGKKSAKLEAKTKAPTPTLTDEEIDLILEACRVEAPENPTRDGDNELKRINQQKWKFCIQLCVAYGLRPCEASYQYLEIRGKIKKYVYCTYVKRTSKGGSPTGRLWSFEDREQKWNLLERLEAKEPLPDLVKVTGRDDEGNEILKSYAGDKWKNFLVYNSAWKKLREQNKDLVPYVFRHSYAQKAHMKFKLSVAEVAFLMRHSVDVHNRNYSDFVTEEKMDISVASAIAEAKRRAKYKTTT